MNFNIPQDKFNSLMFDLLFNVRIELQAMRDTIAQLYYESKGEDDFTDFYKEQLKEVRKTVSAQIKAHYSDFDVDDFLSSFIDE